jgi:hypothetical protein
MRTNTAPGLSQNMRKGATRKHSANASPPRRQCPCLPTVAKDNIKLPPDTADRVPQNDELGSRRKHTPVGAPSPAGVPRSALHSGRRHPAECAGASTDTSPGDVTEGTSPASAPNSACTSGVAGDREACDSGPLASASAALSGVLMRFDGGVSKQIDRSRDREIRGLRRPDAF